MDLEGRVRELNKILVDNPLCGHACLDCEKYGHGYHLEDTVWKAAGADEFDLLCLTCVQKRLGRSLVVEDFSQHPINEPIFAAIAIGEAKSDVRLLRPVAR